MNKKYMRVISIIVIVMIGIGCVDRTIDTTSQKINDKNNEQVNNPTIENVSETSDKESTSEDNITDTSVNESVTESDNSTDTSVDESISESDNITDENDNESVNDNTTVDDNTTTYDSVLEKPVNDTSVTEIFKIGEQKTILGANIKLVNITDYDNNIATISIDNVEYKFDPDSENSIKAKGIEIIDLTTIEDDKTAEITVDYASK